MTSLLYKFWSKLVNPKYMNEDLLRVPQQSVETNSREKPAFTSGRLSRIGMLPEDMSHNLSDDEDTVVSIPIKTPSITSISHSDRMSLNMSDDDQLSKTNVQVDTEEGINNSFESGNYEKDNEYVFEDSKDASYNHSIETKRIAQPENKYNENEFSARTTDIDYLSNKPQSSINENNQHQFSDEIDNCTCSEERCMELNNDGIDINRSCHHNKPQNGSVLNNGGTDDIKNVTTLRSADSSARCSPESSENGSKHSEEDYSSDDEYSSRFSEINQNSGSDKLSLRSEENYDGDNAVTSDEEWEELVMDNGSSEIVQSNQMPSSNIQIEILTEVPNSVSNGITIKANKQRTVCNSDDNSETDYSNAESRQESDDETSREYSYSDVKDFSEQGSNTESDHQDSGSEVSSNIGNKSDKSISTKTERPQEKKVLNDSIKSSTYEYNTDFEECSDSDDGVDDVDRTTDGAVSLHKTKHETAVLGNFMHNKNTYSNISLKSFTGDGEPESLDNSIDLRISGDVSCFTESLSQSEFTSQFNLSEIVQNGNTLSGQIIQSSDKEKDSISIQGGLKAVSPSSIVIKEENENKIIIKHSDKILKPERNANNINLVKPRNLVVKNTKDSIDGKGINRSEVTKKNKPSSIEKSQKANVNVKKAPIPSKELNKSLVQQRQTRTEFQPPKERVKKTLGESALPNINHRDRSPTYAVKAKPFTAESARSTLKGRHNEHSANGTHLRKDANVKGYQHTSYNTRAQTNTMNVHRELNKNEKYDVSKQSSNKEHVVNVGHGDGNSKNERPSSGDSLLSRRRKMSPTSLRGTRLVSNSSGSSKLKSANVSVNLKQDTRLEKDKGTDEGYNDNATNMNVDNGEEPLSNSISKDTEDLQFVRKKVDTFCNEESGSPNDNSNIEQSTYASETGKTLIDTEADTHNERSFSNETDRVNDNPEGIQPTDWETEDGSENKRRSDVTMETKQNQPTHTKTDIDSETGAVREDNSQNTTTRTNDDAQLLGENNDVAFSEHEQNLVQTETTENTLGLNKSHATHTVVENYPHHGHDKHPSRELAKSMITNERRASQSRQRAVHINKRNNSINANKTASLSENNSDSKADSTPSDTQNDVNNVSVDMTETQSVHIEDINSKVERGGQIFKSTGKSSNKSNDRQKIGAVPGENKLFSVKDSRDRRVNGNCGKDTDLLQTNSVYGNGGVKTSSVHKKEQRACSNKATEEITNNTDSSQPHTNKSGAHFKRRRYLQKGPTYENLHEKKLLYKKGGQSVSRQMEKSPTKTKQNQASGLTDLARLQHIRRELNLTDSGDQNLRNTPTAQLNSSEQAVSVEETISSDEVAKSTSRRSNHSNQPSSLETRSHRCTITNDDGNNIVSCFLQAPDTTANLSAFTCDVIDPLDVTPVTRQHEVLVSNIIRLSAADWFQPTTLQLEVSATIPICHQYLKPWQELVIRQLETSGYWSNTQESTDIVKVEDAGKTVYGVQLVVKEDCCVAVVARPRTQCVTLGTQNIAVPSFWDSRIVAHVFGQQENSNAEKQLYFQVVPVDLKTLTDFQASLENDKATCTITASTPLVIMRVSGRSPEAVSFTVPYVSSYLKTDSRSPRPARANQEQPDPPVFFRSGTAELVSRICLGSRSRTDQKQEKTSSKKVETLPPTSNAPNKATKKQDSPREKSRHVVYIGDGGDIRIKLLESKNDESSRNKTFTFSMYERDVRVIVFETTKSMKYNEVQKLASSFISYVVKHRVRLRVSQDPTNVYAVSFSATLGQEGTSAPNRVKQALNPYCSDTETEILLDEGDVINIVFRGNIIVLNQKQILHSFHGYQGIRRKFDVQVADQYSQRSLQGYHGSIQVFVLKTSRKQAMDKSTVPTTGSDWQIKAEFPLNLPKYIKRPPAPLNKAPVAMKFQEPLTVDFICQMSKDTLKDWDIFAAALGVSSARIQSIKQQNRNVVSDRVLMDIIVNWMKKQPVSQNKVEPLLVALRACNKWKLAAELSHRHRAVTLNRSRSLKGENM